jgi:hypothetical protein
MSDVECMFESVGDEGKGALVKGVMEFVSRCMIPWESCLIERGPPRSGRYVAR